MGFVKKKQKQKTKINNEKIIGRGWNLDGLANLHCYSRLRGGNLQSESAPDDR